MTNICILDTETTGLDPKTGNILEIAVIVYNVESKSILYQVSTLIKSEENAAFHINGIHIDSLSATIPSITDDSIKLIGKIMESCDAIVAHNASFDKRWIETVEQLREISINKKWICTKNDIKWPLHKAHSLSLINICCALGIPVIDTHRALSDCTLLVKALDRVPNLVDALFKEKAETFKYKALITFEQRDLAKESGFMWDNVNKYWWSELSREDAGNLTFSAIRIL